MKIPVVSLLTHEDKRRIFLHRNIRGFLQMGAQIERLKGRLQKMGAKNFSFFPGSKPNVTPEEVAREVNKALDEIESGNFEFVTDFED